MKQGSYKCEKCRDTGWVLVPQEKYSPLAVSCEYRELEKVKNTWITSGINPELCNHNFSNFEIWNEASRNAKAAAANYFKDFSAIKRYRHNSILLCGEVGSGKSHLTIALALNLLKKNIKVVYMPYRDIITKLKQNMLNEEFYQRTISKYQSCEVLLIDDLFKGKITESDINIVFEILKYRYLNHLPIIISTEFLIDELLDFDEGVGSRIYEMCKIYMVEIEKGREGNFRMR
ncbi:ATP-binding protein [Clostridium sp.]|uniref:ATP-binding protein n=1 Tax=Clostridium sp. TaxID=1506 RepID=UPI002FC66C99